MGLLAACDVFDDELAGVDPAALSGSDCAIAAERLARSIKGGQRLVAALAVRAADCGAHKERGFSSPATWLAQTSGTTTGEAKAALETVGRLGDFEATRAALLAGEVSLAEAGEIIKTAAIDPAAEADLLDLSARRALGTLREEGKRRRLAAADVEESHKRQKAERHGKLWDADGGMTGLLAMFAPEVGARVRTKLEAKLDGMLRQARKDGSDATVEQLTADAIADLILDRGTATKKKKRSDALVVLVCDIAAYRRGLLEPGEICQLLGAAPVPVATVREEVAAGAFIKCVLHDGKRIEWVAHYGRYRPAHLQTALDLGPAPLFPGVACVDCGRHYGLQWDHVDPVAHDGPTSYDNLQPRCFPCHGDKTERDRAAGLLAPPKPRLPAKPKTGALPAGAAAGRTPVPVESDQTRPDAPHLANPPPGQPYAQPHIQSGLPAWHVSRPQAPSQERSTPTLLANRPPAAANDLFADLTNPLPPPPTCPSGETASAASSTLRPTGCASV